MPPIRMTFGELEAALADNHGIADAKRTAFQARLKNIQRLGLPLRFETSKGKTAYYGPGPIAEMALAVELTQLGLPPDRVVRVLTVNWYAAAMAIAMAARALLERPNGFDDEKTTKADPASIFVFFDPAALLSLMEEADRPKQQLFDHTTETFFYGGEGIIRENIVRLTSGPTSRVSLVNVTAMLDRIMGEKDGEQSGERLQEERREFFSELADWATDRSQEGPATPDVAEDFLLRFAARNFDCPSDDKATARMVFLLHSYFGTDLPIVERAIARLKGEAVNL